MKDSDTFVACLVGMLVGMVLTLAGLLSADAIRTTDEARQARLEAARQAVKDLEAKR